MVVLLSAYRLAAALVGATVGAHPPLHVERLVAVYTSLLEFPAAGRADQVVLLDDVAAVGTEVDAVSELPLEHGQLQLAFAGLFEVFVGAHDEVDQGAEEGKDERDEAPEQAHGTAPGSIGVGPVDEGDPEHDKKQEHELARDPQYRALQKVGDDLERVGILL